MYPIVIIMGVSGSGKSTIGQALSEQTGIPFFDADDYHPPANFEKMKSGQALQDEDRWPWLHRLAELLFLQQKQQRGAILACSALKTKYRDLLANDLLPAPLWIYLDGSPELIAERLQARSGHFMPPALLASQFEALEIPKKAIRVPIDQDVESIVSDILTHFQTP